MQVLFAFSSLVLTCLAKESTHSFNDAEVVVSHYNEDLSWVKEYGDRFPALAFKVYTKSPRSVREASEVLPNVGRESHTYLHHIVKNFDTLANWTIFSQGGAPKWGYIRGNPESGHLTDDIVFSNYVDAYEEGKESFFPLSGVTHLPEGLQLTRLGMLSKAANKSNSECPYGGADGWSAWWFDSRNVHHKLGKDMLEFYRRHVLNEPSLRSELMRPVTLGFVQGSLFAVSRDRIRSRPRSFYENLLAAVSHSDNPVQGYFLEAMWYDIFHPKSQSEVALCEYPRLPRGWGMPEWEMKADVARRLQLKEFGDALQSTYDPYNPDGAHTQSISILVAASMLIAMVFAS